MQFINEVTEGKREPDEGEPGYSIFCQDVAAGFADFARVAIVDEIHLLLLLHEGTRHRRVHSKNPDELSLDEYRDRLAWDGLFRIPTLYDRSFGTEWEDELWDRLIEVMEKIDAKAEE